MNFGKRYERAAACLSASLCIATIIGLWGLMTLPAKHLLRAPSTAISAGASMTANERVYVYRNQRQQIARRETMRHKRNYPTPNWIPASDMMIDPALVYAIIKQESAFNPKARSSAGARGAMQIMPATANYVIKRYGLNSISRVSTANLYDPRVNLIVGQHYLKYLSEKSYIDGNLVYLLAAYNAGPGNLIRWQKQFGHLNHPALFIERIPFKETRDYVKKVLANYRIYQQMFYGQTTEAMASGVWPTALSPELHAQHSLRTLARK